MAAENPGSNPAWGEFIWMRSYNNNSPNIFSLWTVIWPYLSSCRETVGHNLLWEARGGEGECPSSLKGEVKREITGCVVSYEQPYTCIFEWGLIVP